MDGQWRLERGVVVEEFMFVEDMARGSGVMVNGIILVDGGVTYYCVDFDFFIHCDLITLLIR